MFFIKIEPWLCPVTSSGSLSDMPLQFYNNAVAGHFIYIIRREVLFIGVI